MRALRLLAISALALGVMAIPATATNVTREGGYKYLDQGFKLAAHAKKRTELMCPKGTYPYGGGQSNNGGYGQFDQRQTYPIDGSDHDSTPDDGWGLLIKNTGPTDLKGKLFAICGKTKATYLAKKFNFNGFTNQINARPCTKGKLVGGGVIGAGSTTQSSGGPLGTTAKGSYYSYIDSSSQSPQQVTEYSICAHLSTSYGKQGSGTALSPGTEQSRTLICPTGTFVLSGGFGDSGGTSLNSQSPTAVSAGWVVYADATSAFTPLLSALAVCAAPEN